MCTKSVVSEVLRETRGFLPLSQIVPVCDVSATAGDVADSLISVHHQRLSITFFQLNTRIVCGETPSSRALRIY